MLRYLSKLVLRYLSKLVLRYLSKLVLRYLSKLVLRYLSSGTGVVELDTERGVLKYCYCAILIVIMMKAFSAPLGVLQELLLLLPWPSLWPDSVN